MAKSNFSRQNSCLGRLAAGDDVPYTIMRDLLILVAYLLRTVARLLGLGGAKAVVADSLLMKHQRLSGEI